MKRWEQLRNDVEEDYGDLEEGNTRASLLCPACKGGTQQEKSFSVSRRSGILLYNCHRSSCGLRGAAGLSKESRADGASSKSFRSKAYVPAAPASEESFEFLAEKYGLTRESLEFAGLRRVGSDAGIYSGRFCFPIYGPDLRERGAVYRSYEAGVKPKSLTRLYSDDALAMSWYRYSRNSKDLIIVEDQSSAIRMAPHMDSLALLSTNLSDAKVQEIKKQGYNRVFLCLDRDAVGQAIVYGIRYRTELPALQVRGIKKDIKDMNAAEFAEQLEKLL